MKWIKKYNESWLTDAEWEANKIHQDEFDLVKDVVESWIDEFDFDITDYDINAVINIGVDFSGIFYHIGEDVVDIKIFFKVNRVDDCRSEYNKLLDGIPKLVDHLDNVGFEVIVHGNDYSYSQNKFFILEVRRK